MKHGPSFWPHNHESKQVNFKKYKTRNSSRLITALLISTVSFSALADQNSDSNSTSARSFRIQLSAGFGAQFGGLVGAELAVLYKRAKFRGAYSVVGSTFGIDAIVSEKVTVGVQAFTNYINSGYGLSANYHLNSAISKGWFFGIDAFRYGTRSDIDDALVADKLGGFISVGYRISPSK